ncbi:SGNH/GDSL hydrolase family protein [Melittangium boletus]|uniref:Endoglucanase E n=1 Tax=Melittangium boletus DSM 14713 TaxID=1294270 RepID=A0A250IMZ9_9BACT|nr:SGNH/GDSL hydrolase family protein [Melittangium boletus]ATB33129.1 hypothetical protein MEBOL_006618 [Melittangium boletus DSM 14713]
MLGSPLPRLLPVLALVSCEPPDARIAPAPDEPVPEVPTADLLWTDHAPDDPRLQFIGRMDTRTREGPMYAFPGGTVRLRCLCTGVDVRFEDLGVGGEAHTNFIDILVDGESRGALRLQPGASLLQGVRGLPRGEHTIELVKRTEAHAGGVRFQGIRIQGVLLEPPPRPSRRMEFIGDSITCGYGNEASIAAPTYTEPNTGYHARNQDILKAFGPLTARRLGAEWVTTCVSGRGVYRSNDGSRDGVLPLIYGRTLPGQAEPRWEPSRYVPEVIVINLGTNDFAVSDGAGLPTAPPAEPFKQAYAAFVRELRATYPEARIVCAVGPMTNDNYPAQRQLWTTLRRYVSDMVSSVRAGGDTRVHTFAFTPIAGDPYGEDWHPTAAFHARMADELVPFLQGLGD